MDRNNPFVYDMLILFNKDGYINSDQYDFHGKVLETSKDGSYRKMKSVSCDILVRDNNGDVHVCTQENPVPVRRDQSYYRGWFTETMKGGARFPGIKRTNLDPTNLFEYLINDDFTEDDLKNCHVYLAEAVPETDIFPNVDTSQRREIQKLKPKNIIPMRPNSRLSRKGNPGGISNSIMVGGVVKTSVAGEIYHSRNKTRKVFGPGIIERAASISKMNFSNDMERR